MLTTWQLENNRGGGGGEHSCRFVFTIGGMIGVLCEGAKRPSGGRVWDGGYPPPTVGTFSKIRVSKFHFKALKNFKTL